MTDQRSNLRSMGDTGLDRRTFLKGSAGAAAVLTVHTALTLDAQAQDRLYEGLRYLDPIDAQTVEAMAERIWPATDASPGAMDAGVIYYIDQALAGPYVQFRLAYRDGLGALNQVSRSQFGKPFHELSGDQQDELLSAIDAGEIEREGQEGAEEPPTTQGSRAATGEDGLDGETGRMIPGLMPDTIGDLQGFVALVRTHTMEGLFSDPIYGGNADFAGWAAVGYPGPYYVYTEEEQQSFEPLDKPFQSIADFY